MLKIIDKNGKDGYDFKLENGVELWLQDWNGEYYVMRDKDGESFYKPVYEEIEEGGCTTYDVIGFEYKPY